MREHFTGTGAYRSDGVVIFRPDLIDMDVLAQQSNRENLEQAFEIAESLGVTQLLDAEGNIGVFCFCCIFLSVF